MSANDWRLLLQLPSGGNKLEYKTEKGKVETKLIYSKQGENSSKQVFCFASLPLLQK